MTNIGLYNIELYLMTVLVYSVVSLLCLYGDKSIEVLSENDKKGIKRWLISLVLLCLPVNINGNVFTVIGNAKSEKSVYSVWSLCQEAKENALSIIGLSVYQKAGRDTVIGWGFVGYQNAGHEAIVGVGVPLYQKAGDTAITIIGAAGYQNAKDVGLGIGISGYQKGIERAVVFVGAVGYQDTQKQVKTYAAMALYQKAGTADRSFAVFSKLDAPPKDAK